MAKDSYESHDEQEAPRDTLGNSLIVLTCILLLAAVVVMQKAMAAKFNQGMFADKTAATK